MRQQQQTTYKNQTFSLPEEITRDLHSFIKRREMSRFVANAIRKELEVKKQELRDAYAAANNDLGQIEAMEDWQGTLVFELA